MVEAVKVKAVKLMFFLKNRVGYENKYYLCILV
jgi:hypothetical protein